MTKRDELFIEERAAIAVLEGDTLGTPLTLGLIRRALQRYLDHCDALRSLPFWFWKLEDQPWRQILPRMELATPWDASTVIVWKKNPGERIEHLNVARATIALHGQARQEAISQAEVIRRIEAATKMVVSRAHRQCSCEFSGLWSEFLYVGIQPSGDEPDRALELRNCPRCQTTLAREMP